MMGVLLAGVLSLVLKAFFLNLKRDWLTRCCAILPTAIAPFGFKQGRVCCAVQPLNVERYRTVYPARLRHQQPDYPLWRDFPYEYELDRFAIDAINGSTLLREWVDNG